MFENLLFEKKEGIAFMTVNRPSVRNALNDETMHELRTAFEQVKTDAEVRVAILTVAGDGGTQRLPRLIGKGRALHLLLTGDLIPAQEAFRIGLVNQVVPPAQLMDAAVALARKIIPNAPLAIRYTLEAVNRGLEMTQEAGLALEASLAGLSFATQDMKEGVRAFLEKRPPNFTGR